MPREVFVAGQVLTAAELNVVSDQSVMVFAGTAARGSAIPSPTEGMVTYLSDADELQVYTTDWGAVSGGGLVAVKHALKTDPFSASLAQGSAADVTGLSITHAMADASNKLIISAYFGMAANASGYANTSLAVRDDGTKIAVGAAAGSRTTVGAGGSITATSQTFIEQVISVTFVYEPGDTASHTYTVAAISLANGTDTVLINRRELDTDSAVVPRAASGFVIQEVSV